MCLSIKSVHEKRVHLELTIMLLKVPTFVEVKVKVIYFWVFTFLLFEISHSQLIWMTNVGMFIVCNNMVIKTE